MSQVEAPAQEQKKRSKPDETQEPSAGEPEEFKKAVAQAIKDQFKVTDAWMPREAVKFVVSCPSGQQVLVKHLQPMDLIRADLIEDLDSFQRRLFPASLDDSGRPVERDAGKTFFKMMGDPVKRVKFLQVTSRLMAVSSVKPKVIDDGVKLIDSDTYKKVVGEQLDEGEDRREVFGYQVENIDDQIKIFGSPVLKLKAGEAYAGAIGLPDRFTFFTELNKPLELIAPFRESPESVQDLASMQGNGDSSK
jgi:hypothetical protein